MTLIRNIKIAYRDTSSTITLFDTAFKTFKRVVVSRTIDGVCGEFSITMTRPANNSKPFKAGDVIDIKLDGNQVMRGKVYSIDIEGDAFDDYIIISGRDITGDLVDSTVPDSAKVFTDGVGIISIADKIIEAKGLSNDIIAINGTGGPIAPFTKKEIISCEIGDTVIEFLMKYCRKRQLFLNTSPTGALVFFKADGDKTGNRLINNLKNNNNNVTDYKARFSIADRFYKYTCKTQSSGGWSDGNVDSKASVFDPDVSSFRETEFKLEEGFSGSEECKKRAAEESNVRRARAFEYSATVVGFKDKSLWNINQLVNVSDDKAGVQGEFLIREVEYKVDSREGSTSKLTVTNKDAYTAEAALSLRGRQESSKLWYNEKTANDNIDIILEEGRSE